MLLKLNAVFFIALYSIYKLEGVIIKNTADLS